MSRPLPLTRTASRTAAVVTTAAAALVLVATLSAPASPQSAPSLPTLPDVPSAPPAPVSMLRTTGFELRVPGGALIGTRAQRDLMKDAQVTAAQQKGVAYFAVQDEARLSAEARSYLDASGALVARADRHAIWRLNGK